MADDQSLESNSVKTPESGDPLPIHVMSEDVLKDWSSLPGKLVIGQNITKKELDDLYFSLANTQNAIDMTNRAFVHWTNGQLLDAQSSLEASRSSIVAGMNSLRFFFEAIVTGVVKGSLDG